MLPSNIKGTEQPIKPLSMVEGSSTAEATTRERTSICRQDDSDIPPLKKTAGLKPLQRQGSEDLSDLKLSDRDIQSLSEAKRKRFGAIRKAIANIDMPYDKMYIIEKAGQAISDLDKILDGNSIAESFCPESVNTVVSTLVETYHCPNQNEVLQALADCGLGLNQNQHFCNLPPPLILGQLLGNTDNQAAREILLYIYNFTFLILSGTYGYMTLLKAYLTEEEIEKGAQETFIQIKHNASYFEDFNSSYRFPDNAAPCLLRALFNSLHPVITQPVLPDNLGRSPQEITRILHTKLVLVQLCLLENHSREHKQLILAELQKLPQFYRERLLCCAFALGQGQLFGLLKDTLEDAPYTILQRQCGEEGNILHLLASVISDTDATSMIFNYNRALIAYSPNYDRLMPFVPAKELANQRNNAGVLPLTLLYQNNRVKFISQNIMGADNNLIVARRDCLLKFSNPDTIESCIYACFLNHEVDFSALWFREFLLLYRRLQAAGKTIHVTLEERNNTFYVGKGEILPILYFFLEHPDVLQDKEVTQQLMLLMEKEEKHLKYQAQVLRVVSPDIQNYLLGCRLSTQDGWNKLFIDRHFKLYYHAHERHLYPWHLLGLGTIFENHFSSNPPLATTFLQAVSNYQADHQKSAVPNLPASWERELLTSAEVIPYGRSLACPSQEVSEGYRRFKFLKKQPGATEDWMSFIREQPHLDFFRQHRDSLGLESALLKPKGIYRLTDACQKLGAIGLPDLTLSSIAIEPDGSAYVQVFDDGKDTKLYHRYPYNTQGEKGLSVNASFKGLRLFARDAGRLVPAGFQAPDALPAFHNLETKRVWSSTPFFGGGETPGILEEWSAQDYPNIAPAPVGMRDWADGKAFREYTSTNFGRTVWFDATSPEIQSQLKVSELGKAFYGLVINWLRVRHDTDCLDYKNKQHMSELAEELVLIASDLFGTAHGMEPSELATRIRQWFPAEALSRATLECGYWCDPNFRYVDDIKSCRFPTEIYPDHPDGDLYNGSLEANRAFLTDQGLRYSSKTKGPNLGVSVGTLPLCHLDSLFWFCILAARRDFQPLVTTEKS